MMQIESQKIVGVSSRTGRELQRYLMGCRQVVGCIPYRYIKNKRCSSVIDKLEVLLVSSQKCETMMFPKGGWEADESMEEAVLRESLEEAGVIGTIQSSLGQWRYKSKSEDTVRDGYMFGLLVEEQLDYWPEKNVRQRKWVKVKEAKELCPYIWMNEALDKLVQTLAQDKAFETQASLSPSFLQTPSSPSYFEAQLNIVEGGDVSCHTNISAKLNVVEDDVCHHTLISAQLNLVKSEVFNLWGAQLNVVECEVTLSSSVESTTCGIKRNLALACQPRNVETSRTFAALRSSFDDRDRW